MVKWAWMTLCGNWWDEDSSKRNLNALEAHLKRTDRSAGIAGSEQYSPADRTRPVCKLSGLPNKRDPPVRGGR